MQDNLYFNTIKTTAGWLAVLASNDGLLALALPEPTKEGAIRKMGANGAKASPEKFEELADRLSDYFDGLPMEFPEKLDLSSYTPFQRLVWQAARTIPYGETRSYAQVARQISKAEASRAVGQALGRNPLPIIIPCHRVLTSEGRLGGYSGGLAVKKQLLTLEAMNYEFKPS